jgi:ribonuclease HI
LKAAHETFKEELNKKDSIISNITNDREQTLSKNARLQATNAKLEIERNESLRKFSKSDNENMELTADCKKLKDQIKEYKENSQPKKK